MRRRLAGPLAFLGLIKNRALDRVDASAEQAGLDAGGAFVGAADERGLVFCHCPGQAVIVIEDLIQAEALAVAIAHDAVIPAHRFSRRPSSRALASSAARSNSALTIEGQAARADMATSLAWNFRARNSAMTSLTLGGRINAGAS